MGAIKEKMKRDMEIRGLSKRTQEHYLGCIKHKAMILTLDSTGIRASELANVKVSDIDSKRMLIRIDQGKNRKDRYVRLPARLLEILREYWQSEKVKSKIWLFPGTIKTPGAKTTLGSSGYLSESSRTAGKDQRREVEGGQRPHLLSDRTAGRSCV